jgi:DNA-binding transcriptional ArsR family regulator
VIEDEQAASYLKALGHPVRIRMVQELLKGPKNVGEVERSLGISQANASQHLSILRINGIVGFTRKGNIKMYSLKEPKKIQNIMDALKAGEQKGEDR